MQKKNMIFIIRDCCCSRLIPIMLVAANALDVQVTDMMIANGSYLVLTICPFNQSNNVSPRRFRPIAGVAPSGGLQCNVDAITGDSTAVEETDNDEVHDHTSRLESIARAKLTTAVNGRRRRSGNRAVVASGAWNNRVLRT
jgi:hypothetical protein